MPAGSVFGFLGPNGAGKTTTLRILGGLARPTAGSAAVLGHDVASAGNAVRTQIGFLPDVPGFYKWMTAAEFLRFAGGLFSIDDATLRARVAALLDLAGLASVDARIGTFSRGMKQRLGVAQALINAPRLLLLDEPTSALDPIGRKEVLDMIAALAGRTTVFFSTHILADVERVCDTVAVLDRGRVVAQDSIDGEAPPRPRPAAAGRGRRPRAARRGRRRPSLGAPGRTQRRYPEPYRERPGHRRARAAGVIAAAGLALRRLEADEVSLEEVLSSCRGEPAVASLLDVRRQGAPRDAAHLASVGAARHPAVFLGARRRRCSPG